MSISAENNTIHIFGDVINVRTNQYNEMYLEYVLSLVILFIIPIIILYFVYVEIKRDKRKYQRRNHKWIKKKFI